MKRIILGGLAVFVAWMILDYVIHEVILSGAYASVADVWRPMEEMKRGLGSFVGLTSALAFSLLYGKFVGCKSQKTGIQFGLLFGFIIGIGMGYGTYALIPIPYVVALTWFLGTTVEGGVAGLLVGTIVKDEEAAAQSS